MDTKTLRQVANREVKKLQTRLESREGKFGKDQPEEYYIKGAIDAYRTIVAMIDPQEELVKELVKKI